MTTAALLTLVILGAVALLLVPERLPPSVTALAAIVALAMTGVLTPDPAAIASRTSCASAYR